MMASRVYIPINSVFLSLRANEQSVVVSEYNQTTQELQVYDNVVSTDHDYEALDKSRHDYEEIRRNVHSEQKQISSTGDYVFTQCQAYIPTGFAKDQAETSFTPDSTHASNSGETVANDHTSECTIGT